MKETDWAAYVFDPTAFEKEITGIEGTSQLKCRFFRNKENFINKVWKTGAELTDLDKDNIRQEIRAICSNWLKMQNVCALLGAGASKCILGFVGKDMYPKIKHLLKGRQSIEVLNTIETMSSSPADINVLFEEFLSQLTLLKRIMFEETKPLDKMTVKVMLGEKEIDIKAKTIDNLLLDTQRALITLFNVSLPGGPLTLAGSKEDILPHEAFLAKLVSRDPQQGRARIFTLNYDTLIEQAMDRLGIMYADGFTGTIHRRFNPIAYDLDSYYPGEVTEGRVRRYDKVIQLFKLHGSINWRTSPLRAGDPFGIYFDSRPLPTEQDVLKNPKVLDIVLEDGKSSLAILPISTKYGESITMPYAHLFRTMFASLKEPQTVCFVIGYRGWDNHVNRVIEDSLTNPSFNCVIVDPNLSNWAKGLLSADYSGRVYAFEGEWGKFENFSKTILPDIEMLKTDLLIARTMRDLQKGRLPEGKA